MVVVVSTTNHIIFCTTYIGYKIVDHFFVKSITITLLFLLTSSKQNRDLLLIICYSLITNFCMRYTLYDFVRSLIIL